MHWVAGGLGTHALVTHGLGAGEQVAISRLRMRFQSQEPAMARQSKSRDQTHTTVETMRKVT